VARAEMAAEREAVEGQAAMAEDSGGWGATAVGLGVMVAAVDLEERLLRRYPPANGSKTPKRPLQSAWHYTAPHTYNLLLGLESFPIANSVARTKTA